MAQSSAICPDSAIRDARFFDQRSSDAVMQTVASTDGTRIAFWRTGHGPPLLLVHGATADHTTTWRFVLADLERRFTVYAMDRRGRGGVATPVRTTFNARPPTWLR